MAKKKRDNAKEGRGKRAKSDAKMRNACTHQVPDGWNYMPRAASDMTPCGCTVETFGSVPAVPLAWRVESSDYAIKCLVCGEGWLRRIVPDAYGRIYPGHLAIDGSHPQEAEARAAKIAKRKRRAAIERLAR